MSAVRIRHGLPCAVRSTDRTERYERSDGGSIPSRRSILRTVGETHITCGFEPQVESWILSWSSSLVNKQSRLYEFVQAKTLVRKRAIEELPAITGQRAVEAAGRESGRVRPRSCASDSFKRGHSTRDATANRTVVDHRYCRVAGLDE